MIACCGLVCSECPAFVATKANDAARIDEIAKQWSQQFNANVTAASVWCDGCTAEGRKCGHCAECDVRACVLEKKLDNCGKCAEFTGCDTIGNFLKMAPHAKPVLEEIYRTR
jgi:hypothetical protein